VITSLVCNLTLCVVLYAVDTSAYDNSIGFRTVALFKTGCLFPA